MTRPGNGDGVTLGRRTYLRAVGGVSIGGSALVGTAGATASGFPEDVGPFSVTQGDDCRSVVPLWGTESVGELYDYRVPEQYGGDNGATDPGEGPYFQSNGTTDLQTLDTTISFLYLGPRGLSLVVVHDTANGGGEKSGGSVTWRLRDVPADAEWVVMDDYYLDPETGRPADSNYDNWDVEGTTHDVDWTWGTAGTDGGALRTLDPRLGFTVEPAYNEAAELWGDHYGKDPIEGWQFLSFPDGRESPERIGLALDEPVSVDPGPCGGFGHGEEDGGPGLGRGRRRRLDGILDDLL